MITRRHPRTVAGRQTINDVAAELVQTYGPVILEDAYRFSACKADAEDAYQRTLEILLTKAPSTDPEQLKPWIRTVARREAIAIARKRKRVMEIHDLSKQPALDYNPDDRVEMMAEASLGMEALSTLSQDQIRCLLAQAEGFNHEEIAEITGFSRRKVTRCISEGRMKFLSGVQRISTGSECDRLRHTIERFAEGDQAAALKARVHLRGCAACREHLRDSRLAHRRVRAIFPPGLFLVKSPPVDFIELLSDLGSTIVSRTKNFVSHPLESLATTNAKLAATAAVVGVVAVGGLMGVVRDGEREDSHRGNTASQPAASSYELVELQTVAPAERPERKSSKKKRSKRSARETSEPRQQRSVATPNPQPTPEAVQNTPRPVDDGSSEFLPEQR